MSNILNIAGYKFIKLDDLEKIRDQFKLYCIQQKLKGTILLAPEGINIMVAGLTPAIEDFINWLKNDDRFQDIEFKKSYSEIIPFKRVLIKIKKEIISFSVPNVNPALKTAPKISPENFKQWLDHNKDMMILDTRNQCEIELGKFAAAVDLGINNFREFPQAAKKILPVLKQKPIVTYCTGGIRCEKAAAYLLQLGFQKVYQLDGGILKYFAEYGDAYFQGKCFVFDERIALDKDLK